MTRANRIDATFARLKDEGRTGFVAFVTTGYPSLDATLEIVPGLVAGGADIIELGVPFSDPLAEGPTIQRSSFAALENGVTPAACLDVIRTLRSRGLEAPIIPMGYYNPVLAYGIDEFCHDASKAGADGLIVVDLPPEESDALHAACAETNLRLIYLLAPTSTPERIARVAKLGSGFIYCVSLTGVTGARDELTDGLSQFIERVRSSTDLPIAVGFGISQRKHFQSVGRIADAAVIGSAIIDVIDGGHPSEAAARVKQYAEVVTGRREATA
jgi:tryptophan synthase alpha chain